MSEEHEVSGANRGKTERRGRSRSPTGGSPGAWGAIVATLLMLNSAAVLAEGGNGVDAFYGSFGTEIPIEVPPFHGLQPRVALAYSSTTAAGFAGVGWNLTSFSTIERSAARRGTPRYDAADVFYLDGMLLDPCTSQGGTHCTHIQNYARITFDASANRWTVVGTNGNTVTYAPIYAVAGGTFRWGISTVADRRGNVVNYSWWCEARADCYPTAIAYGGVTVTLWREDRPDRGTFANGGDALGQTNYRLKTIDVSVAGSRVRAYKLAYVQSASTGRTLLASVQQFGTDAVLDASGAVTAGTSLPAMTMQYQDQVSGAEGFGTPQNWGSSALLGSTNDSFPMLSGSTGDFTQLVDMNGDGRPDYVAHFNYLTGQAGLWVALNEGGRFAAPVNWNSAALLGNAGFGMPRWSNGTDFSQLIDMNADGRPDYVSFYNYTNSQFGLWVLINTGSGFAAPVNWNSAALLGNSGNSYPRWSSSGTDYTTLSDMNGDGRPDYVAYYNYLTGQYGLWVLINTGAGFAAPVNWGSSALLGNAGNSYPLWGGGLSKLADMNGDGLPDYVSYYNFLTAQYGMWVLLNTGSGFGSPKNWNTAALLGNVNLARPRFNNGSDLTQLVDMNGDGRLDYVSYYNFNAGQNGLWVLLNTGGGFAAPQNWGTADLFGNAVDAYPRFANDGNDQTSLMDMNGDGRPDFVAYYNYRVGQAGLWVALSTGAGFGPPRNWNSGTLLGSAVNGYVSWTGVRTKLVDMNGDGLPEYTSFYNYASGSYGLWVLPNPCRAPDLLRSLANGLGGITAIGYTPSTAYANTYLPPGMIVQTVSSLTTTDGRGASSTMSYLFQGGLWSDRERRFLGFRYVRAVIDAAGDYTEVYYHQGVGDISKPDATYLRSATGSIFNYTTYGYTESATAPYTSLLTSRWEYQCDLSATCRRLLHTFTFDTCANVVEDDDYGDYDVAGDEATRVRGYAPNTSGYIVGLPAYENTYAGIGTSGRLLKQSLMLYDGSTNISTPPTIGDQTELRNWNDQTGANVSLRFAYDAWGNRVSETSATGGVGTVTFDATHVFPTRECDANHTCVSRTWNVVTGLETSTVDPNGAVTTHLFDVLGRPTAETRPDGSQTTWKYVAWGDPNAQAIRKAESDGSAEGVWTDKFFDGLRRTYKTLRKDGTTQSWLYSDTSSRKWKESLPYAPATEPARYVLFAYDGTGRVQTVTAPDGSVAQTLYASGPGFSTVAEYDELGHERVTWRDARGQTTQIREKLGTAYMYTTSEVDPLGRVTRTVDASGKVATYTYNSLGWKLSQVDPDMGAMSYAYDAAGRQTSSTNARNQTTTTTYDVGGRRTQRRYPGGAQVLWTYDEPGHGAGLGRVTTVTDPSGSESYVYDAAGNVTASTKCVHGACYVTKQSFDGFGRLAATTYPDNEVVTYGYDAMGRLTSMPGLLDAVTYSSTDQITALAYANHTSTSYQHDPNRRWLMSASVAGPTGTLYQASYQYDATARVVSVGSTTDPSMRSTYTYDDLGRLVGVNGAQTQTFTYDATGNILSNSAVGTYKYQDASHAHAVTTAGANTYAYDANGNMINGGGRTLTWNFELQPTSIVKGSQTWSFDYDYGGARVFESTPSGTTTTFGPLWEVKDGVPTKHYVAGKLVIGKKDARGVAWYHCDHLGSLRLMTDAAGAAVLKGGYSAYGVTTSRVGPATDPIGFDGHRADDALGLIYMGARYYDPALGRFLSADAFVPSGRNPQALNRYAFAYNNPISNADPSGHNPISAVTVAMNVIAMMQPGITTMQALACLGTALTVSGVASHDPWLAAVSSVFMGYGAGFATWGTTGGALLGAGTAAATSSVSPLSPGVKQAIGWAYAGLGAGKDVYEFFGKGQSLDDLADNVAAHVGRENVIKDVDAHLVGHYASDGHVVVDGIFGIFTGNVPRNFADALKFTFGMQTDGGDALLRVARANGGMLEFTSDSLVESQGTMFFAELNAAHMATGAVTLRAVTYQTAFSFLVHGVSPGLSVSMQAGANDFVVAGMAGGMGLAKTFATLAGIPYESKAYGLGMFANHAYDASPTLGYAQGIVVHNGF